MKKIGAFEAKTHLAELLDRARRGERITITKRGVAVAMLVPVEDGATQSASEAFEELRRIRARTRPGRQSVRQLRDEGRRR